MSLIAAIDVAAAAEAEMRETAIDETGADAQMAVAIMSPLALHPNHSFKGSQIDCYEPNRPL